MSNLIYFDSTKCDNCKDCVGACERAHFGVAHMFIQPVDGSYLASNCRQCELSPCVEACPTGACEQTKTGVAAIAPMKCVGCQLCAIACPFGAIWFDALNKISRKCDLCMTRLSEVAEPACVEACGQHGALFYGELEEMLAVGRVRPVRTLMTRAAGSRGTLVGIPQHLSK